MDKLITLKPHNPEQAFRLLVEENADYWLILCSGLVQYVSEVKPNWITTAVQTFTYLENSQSDKSQPSFLLRVDYYLPLQNDGLVIRIKPRTYHQRLITAFELRYYGWNWGDVSFYPPQAFG